MRKEELLTTCFGLGKLPICPGTWGSLPPVVIYQVLGYLGPVLNVYVMAFFVVLGSWICLQYVPAVILTTGPELPHTVVADKLAGQALTMWMIVVLGPNEICNSMALGFALFRLVDITRPWPCRRLYDMLRPGQGILAQGLMAGVYAGAVACLLIRFFPTYFGQCYLFGIQ